MGAEDGWGEGGVLRRGVTAGKKTGRSEKETEAEGAL